MSSAFPVHDHDSDPTLAIAQRQLVMLAELAEMAMTASRAFAASAVAASEAESMILAEECFTPEVGRARACGAKDAADSFQKVSRAVRLTLKLEMRMAEIVRDIRAGVVTYIGGTASCKEAGENAGAPADRARSLRRSAGVLAGSSSLKETPDRDRLDRDVEPLFEFDRPDAFPRTAYVLAGVTPGKEAGEDAGAPADIAQSLLRSAGVLAGSCLRDETPDRVQSSRDAFPIAAYSPRPDVPYPKTSASP